ncbi:MAG: hydroxymethylbilane synthase [Candidatus Caenarcaniphilales bacterium]|nr:hydroxymethylbilane synthase [Candidatus Caenarcaniphilales bacterium]
MSENLEEIQKYEHIKIGSRDSQLALLQSNMVKNTIETKYPNIHCEIIKIKTQGDKILDTALSKIGDKGLFVKELEVELTLGNVDIAVHSMKDMPTVVPPGLKLIPALKREDVRDIVCLSKEKIEYFKNNPIPEGDSVLAHLKTIGTSSLRRIAQIKAKYPHLEVKDIRGNLNTRFRKLDDPELGYDAIVLAAAGVKRLSEIDDSFLNRASEFLDPVIVKPAVAQGALAIEFLEERTKIEELINSLEDSPEQDIQNNILAIERNFLNELEGGCQIPIGIYSERKEKTVCFHSVVSSLDGTDSVENRLTKPYIELTPRIGREIAQKLKSLGAEKLLSIRV